MNKKKIQAFIVFILFFFTIGFGLTGAIMVIFGAIQHLFNYNNIVEYTIWLIHSKAGLFLLISIISGILFYILGSKLVKENK